MRAFEGKGRNNPAWCWSRVSEYVWQTHQHVPPRHRQTRPHIQVCHTGLARNPCFRTMLTLISGDDRDYCEYAHIHIVEGTDEIVSVREVTVKSFSPDKGVHNPGFHLLSLVPPHSVVPSSDGHTTTFADMPCFLPSHARIYGAVYPTWAIITIILLLIRRYTAHRNRPRQLSPLPSYQFESGSVHDSKLSTRQTALMHSSVADEKLHNLQRKRHLQNKQETMTPAGASIFRSAGSRLFWLASAPFTKSSRVSNGVGASGPWRASSHLLWLASLDFFRVVGPSLALWGLVLWSMLR